MSGVKKVRAVAWVVIALVSAACGPAVPGSSTGQTAPNAGPSSGPATTAPTTAPSPAATAGIVFRALDVPSTYSRAAAEAVDGTTAVGWVQAGMNDEAPAIWDTTTGALEVLQLPDRFVHPSGETFVRLVGVSAGTAAGTGILGAPGDKRGQSRALAWNLATGELRTLDIPDGFTQAEAHAISGTLAVGQVWTAHGESGRPVAWDTATGAVTILKLPAGYGCGNPTAVSGDTIIGTRCDLDDARPIVWNGVTSVAKDLDVLTGHADGVPRSVDGATAAGNCCFGEEGTPLPLTWDTNTGAVHQLALPTQFMYGAAYGISGSVVIGRADFTPLVWDLTTGEAAILPMTAGYDAEAVTNAVSGRTIVGYACQPPASSSENPRCVAAAWTLP